MQFITKGLFVLALTSIFSVSALALQTDDTAPPSTHIIGDQFGYLSINGGPDMPAYRILYGHIIGT